MDSEVLVDHRLEDGQALIEQLVRDGFQVTLAFWVKTSAEGLCFLYIASPRVDEEKIGEVYRAVYASLHRIADPWLSLSEIRLVSDKDPIAVDALEVLTKHPGRMPIRYRGRMLGGVAVEEAYIYPPPVRFPRNVGEERRLKKDVEQVDRPEDFLLTAEEKGAINQLVAQGMNAQQAEAWVRKKRTKQQPRLPIPAGTVVRTWVAAYWGDRPEDDPNPLLRVKTPDGAEGLTFKEDTEPIQGS